MAKRSEARALPVESQTDDAERVSGVQVASVPPPATTDAEPTEAELQEAGAEVVAASKRDDLTEGMLARYFRDMAIHTVMSPEEEVNAAPGLLGSRKLIVGAPLWRVPAGAPHGPTDRGGVHDRCPGRSAAPAG